MQAREVVHNGLLLEVRQVAKDRKHYRCSYDGRALHEEQ